MWQSGQMPVTDHELHPQVTGAGKNMKQVDGMHSGHCCQKLFLLAGNSCIVGTRKDAENNASVARLHSKVLHSVYGMDSVPKIYIKSNE